MQENRKRRFEELIHREISNLLLHSSCPSFTKITIIRVSVTSDLSLSKIFFSVFDNIEIDIINELLKKKTTYLRKMLAKKMNFRITPKICFIYDKSIKYNDNLVHLIDSAIISNDQ